MQMMTVTLAVTLSCLLILNVNNADAAPSRQRRGLMDLERPELTLAVLEELIDDIKTHSSISAHKRRIDAGYGSRYGVASSVGSKLMALKQAADWNGPGRKRRDAEAENDME